MLWKGEDKLTKFYQWNFWQWFGVLQLTRGQNKSKKIPLAIKNSFIPPKGGFTQIRRFLARIFFRRLDRWQFKAMSLQLKNCFAFRFATCLIIYGSFIAIVKLNKIFVYIRISDMYSQKMLKLIKRSLISCYNTLETFELQGK